jgi:hypothetical protein
MVEQLESRPLLAVLIDAPPRPFDYPRLNGEHLRYSIPIGIRKMTLVSAPCRARG